MNQAQELRWRQAQSDHSLFRVLLENGAHECHLLHYLQMATEKLSKAYFWRSGEPPPKSHAGFVRYLRALLDRSTDLDRVARTLGFGRQADLEHWVQSIRVPAYSVQNMAPAEAGNGPNPEYPWPHEAPSHYPAGHRFSVWNRLNCTGKGRKLVKFIERAITRFESYA